MKDLTVPQEVGLGGQGRLVIPAGLRRALGFEKGDRLVARMENSRLIIEKVDRIKQGLKDRFTKTNRRSLANELITQRRQEAKNESPP